MNRNKTSFSFLLEYLFVLLAFMLCATITVRIFAFSYLENDLSIRKREALEYITNYIETGDYSLDEFSLDEEFSKTDSGIYKVSIQEIKNDYSNLEIRVTYKEECLLSMPFYGEIHE